MVGVFFFFKQKTAYEIYQCDWSSDVCSSDLAEYMPTEVKKSVLGYGRGSKEQIQHMIRLMLNLPDRKSVV